MHSQRTLVGAVGVFIAIKTHLIQDSFSAFNFNPFSAPGLVDMSVFRGSIAEYPGVVVDHYIPVNCERGRVFFLSHCHKDHMTGLGSRALLDALRRRGTFLYCSEVTRALLLHYTEFRDLVPFLKALPMEEPVCMKLEPASNAPALSLTVTLLPAGHCPGSAMFLFEGSNGTALYTGDFRLTADETKRIQPLHPGGKLLDISTLYLDTTFCSPMATDIPDRETSRQYILSFASDWLARSPQNAVLLQCSMFGYEHVFMGISQKLCTKVHIGSWRHTVYSEIPAVHECLTIDGQSTRVHCCSYQKGRGQKGRGQGHGGGLPCGAKCANGRPFQVLTIKPSTQWFLNSNKTTGSCTDVYTFLPEQNMYRVMHSMHSSFSEICNFVGYIRPKEIVPCVVPTGDSALTEAHARLKVYLSGPVMQHSLRAMSNHEPVMGVDCRRGDEEDCSSESDPEWLGGGGGDSPVVKGQEEGISPPLALPSMLTDRGEENSPSSVQGLESVCTGGTIGSLEQTPIDLYLSCDSSPPSSQEPEHKDPVAANDTGFKATDTGKPVKRDHPAGSLSNPVILDDDTFKGFGEPVTDTTFTGLARDMALSTNGIRKHSFSSCVENEEVMILEQPHHHQRRHSSAELSHDSRDLEPHAKRSRLSCPGGREMPACPVLPSCVCDDTADLAAVQHPQLHPPLATDSEVCPSLVDHIGTTKSIVFIDLTQDKDDNSEGKESGDSDVVWCGTRPGAQLASALGGEDTSSDPESPGCLPPSPGREMVGSILKRKALGF